MKAGLVIGLAAVLGVGGLIGYNTYKKRRDEAAYAELQRSQQAARQAVAESHRAAAAPRLATLAKAVEEAKAAPPIASRVALTRPVTVPVTVRDDSGHGNTMVSGIAQPADLNVWLVKRYQPLAEDYVGPGARPREADNRLPQEVEAGFAELAALDYVVLVRIQRVTPPTAGPGDRFVGGAVEGDAALYELASGTRLGGFPFVVRQRDTASVTRRGDVDRQLLEAFQVDVGMAIPAELAAFVAGTAGPATPGAAAAAELARFGDKIESELRLTYIFLEGVEVASGGADGKPIVTLVSDHPERLQFRGQVLPELATAIQKILGVEAEFRFRQRTPPPTP
jgi:hypothetical protein